MKDLALLRDVRSDSLSMTKSLSLVLGLLGCLCAFGLSWGQEFYVVQRVAGKPVGGRSYRVDP